MRHSRGINPLNVICKSKAAIPSLETQETGSLKFSISQVFPDSDIIPNLAVDCWGGFSTIPDLRFDRILFGIRGVHAVSDNPGNRSIYWVKFPDCGESVLIIGGVATRARLFISLLYKLIKYVPILNGSPYIVRQVRNNESMFFPLYCCQNAYYPCEDVNVEPLSRVVIDCEWNQANSGHWTG